MSKIEEAQTILRALGLPPAKQNEMSALILLALCGTRPGDSWYQARRQSLTVTKGIMAFVEKEYRRSYAPNTRETFRRQVLHQFVQARIADYNPDAPNLPTNSPRAHYAISPVALKAIKA
ncbi:MAG: restriction endonuclease, partial [Chloroflexi bacterium]|nr:restriction endonuclease [Chloroflexota bacterium]